MWRLDTQDEDEGPANFLDEELQQQLNEMADYESDQEAAQPSVQAVDQGNCSPHSHLNAPLVAKLHTPTLHLTPMLWL